MENKQSSFPLILGICILVVLVLGATYAYFIVGTTNSFNTTTINATADSVGSVALTNTNSTLSMNLTSPQMMRGNDDIIYYGQVGSNQDATTVYSMPIVGLITVTGTGTYSCDYTLSVTASGTNNMYTAFQNLSAANKSDNQIRLFIDSDRVNALDFDTASLFPATISGTFHGLTSSSTTPITAQLEVVNRYDKDQTGLANTDLAITITASRFTCTATESNSYYNQNNLTPSTTRSGLNYYIKDFADEGAVNQVCAIINNSEVCLRAADWVNRTVYKEKMERNGATCNYGTGSLECSYGNVYCHMLDRGKVLCGDSVGNCYVTAIGITGCESTETEH